MELAELVNLQKGFDGNHHSNFDWNLSINNDNIEILEFLILSLFGEVGEAANIVKKVIRGDFDLSDKYEDLKEEIADIFIYVLKLSYQLNFSLEDAYLKKMTKNTEKFKNYEKS